MAFAYDAVRRFEAELRIAGFAPEADAIDLALSGSTGSEILMALRFQLRRFAALGGLPAELRRRAERLEQPP